MEEINMDTIENLTKQINMLAESYYEKISDIGRQICAERCLYLEDKRDKLIRHGGKDEKS